MATFAHRGKSWRAQIRLRGVSDSKAFRTKAEAAAWAAEREAAIRRGEGGSGGTTLRDALEGFQRDVSPGRRGAKWEHARIGALLSPGKRGRKPLLPFLDRALRDLTPAHFESFRDRRLKDVAKATVLRELALLSGVLEWARTKKRWIAMNPVHDVDKPRQPKPRERLITKDEERRLLLALGYERGTPGGPSEQVGLIFLIALETAMRSGEIVGMTAEHLHLDRAVAHVPLSKNGDPRDVPLTARAVELWKRMPAASDGRIFTISDESRDVLFRRAVAACEIEDLHFHDTRATALTRLSRLVDVMTLARISGHRDINTLYKTYYRERPEEIAKRLDAVTGGAARGDASGRNRAARPAASAAKRRRQ